MARKCQARDACARTLPGYQDRALPEGCLREATVVVRLRSRMQAAWGMQGLEFGLCEDCRARYRWDERFSLLGRLAADSGTPLMAAHWVPERT